MEGPVISTGQGKRRQLIGQGESLLQNAEIELSSLFMNLSGLPDFELLKDRIEASVSVSLNHGKHAGNACGIELEMPLTTFRAVCPS